MAVMHRLHRSSATFRLKRDNLSHWMARSAWALMFVGHLPACTGLLTDLVDGQFDPLRFFGLTLSQLFLLGKVADVGWLRLPATGRARMAVFAGIVLLHGGVLERTISHDINGPECWQIVTVGTVAAVGVAHLRRTRLVRFVRPRLVRQQTRRAWEILRNEIAAAWLPPRYACLARAVSINRAPPR